MSEQAYTDKPYVAPKWYNHPDFPLLPQLTKKPGNEHNTSGFFFQWLFIRIWLLDAPGFELSVVADSHWGLGFVGTLLYLRWCLCLPMPRIVKDWSYRTLWRRPVGFRK